MKHIEAVSKVTNILKTNNKDSRLSRRFILKVLRDSVIVLLVQKLLDRSIYNESSLYSIINCLEMVKIDKIDCPLIEMRTCKTIMKSKKKLPKLLYSRLGSSIKEITSVDGEFQFTIVNEAQYRRNNARQQKLKSEIYCYIDGEGYLYIADKEIYTVNASLITLETEKLNEVSSCSNSDGCENYWNAEFICPDRLLDAVFQQTLATLGMTKQIHSDPNPNGIENA